MMEAYDAKTNSMTIYMLITVVQSIQCTNERNFGWNQFHRVIAQHGWFATGESILHECQDQRTQQ